ncbi:MAG: family peptidase [Paenibacillaceae bacterium]|nr:family peptidase [Paenibacillaceae bacterium]
MSDCKIAVIGIYHETNTFAPGATVFDDFREEWVDGEAAWRERYTGTGTTMGGVIAKADELGVTLVPGLYASTMPSGTIEAGAADALIEAVISSADPSADGVFVILHGAMVAANYPDMEGELLSRLRERIGLQKPVAVTLDLHSNTTRRMVEHANIIIGYDTYPHVDTFDRAAQAMDLLHRTIVGRIRPVQSLAQPGMMVVPQAMLTSQGAMKDLMDVAFAIEQVPGILNVTVAGGFPYSDMADAGMSFLVTADGDAELAGRMAARLADFAWQQRERFALSFVAPEQAVREAFAAAEGPVILTEGSDNVGGGAPGDATHVLRWLTDPPVRCLAVICDPAEAAKAHRLGVGAAFEGEVGGKNDRLHGDPVRLAGTVRLLADGKYTHVGPYMTGKRADMGRTAVIECGNLTLVLTEKRNAPWDVGHVRSIGLWPDDFHVIVVKSAIAWRTAFGTFAKKVIDVESPGACTSNLRLLNYTRLKRPIYPLD